MNVNIDTVLVLMIVSLALGLFVGALLGYLSRNRRRIRRPAEVKRSW
jgi:hypothetical protein